MSTVTKQDTAAWSQQLNEKLENIDPELFDIIEHEKARQIRCLQLIASENFTSSSVMEALGSILTNKYSEGLPGARFYAGNEFIDASERLCQKRALEAFHLNPAEWGVNVQPLSGSPANFEVYTALLKPHDRILALDLPHGGHLSHGYQTPTKKVSAVSTYFETLPYRVDEKTGIIKYDQIEELSELYRPKMIIAGTSAYSRLIDYKRIRAICDKHNALMLADIAHISGLVAAQVIPSPFEYADIVTTTTHKSLRGPRGAMIFFRKGTKKDAKTGKDIPYEFEEKINSAVFPGHQGGPHNHTIGALAVALKLAATKEFKQYQEQVVKNSKIFAEKMIKLGYKIISDGTDNHLSLVDMRPFGLDGARADKVLEVVSIIANKNTLPGDKNALVPGGIRVGSPCLTSRGFLESDFEKVAELFDRAIKLAVEINKSLPQGSKLIDFKTAVDKAVTENDALKQLKKDVETFALSFPAVGFDTKTMKYPPKLE